MMRLGTRATVVALIGVVALLFGGIGSASATPAPHGHGYGWHRHHHAAPQPYVCGQGFPSYYAVAFC